MRRNHRRLLPAGRAERVDGAHAFGARGHFPGGSCIFPEVLHASFLGAFWFVPDVIWEEGGGILCYDCGGICVTDADSQVYLVSFLKETFVSGR